jgi:Holliday junction resolvase RusA-like endonuclease
VIEFTVPGEPAGKARPKFSTFGGHVRAITPKQTVSYENYVKLAYSQAYPGRVPFEKDVPLLVSIKAYFKTPASVSKKKHQAMLEDRIRPTKKPDCDNIAKAVLDALNGIAYYDDSQVVTVTVEKLYSDTPRVEVEMEAI